VNSSPEPTWLRRQFMTMFWFALSAFCLAMCMTLFAHMYHLTKTEPSWQDAIHGIIFDFGLAMGFLLVTLCSFILGALRMYSRRSNS